VKRLTRTAGGFAVSTDIGNTGVVKTADPNLVGVIGVPPQAGGPADGRTREAVARLLMEQGPITAAEVAAALELSSPAVRRHLDALIVDGEAEVRQAPRRGPRGRGRPARQYLLTDSGRARFGHKYDDLAVAALRYLAQHGGPDAIAGFAQSRVEELLGGDGIAQIEAAHGADARTTALATVLTARGYAAQARDAGHGVQLCQHHCPVAHVAAEFPALCEAETHAFAELLGTHVQRLATIARGDSACTTHVPLEIPESRRATTTITIPRGRQSE
jgi:predicted ArsR family transcriptional regulator